MKAVHAECDDGCLFRERAHPLLDPLWVAPDRALRDVLTAGRVVARTCVDQLNFLARLDHGLHVLWCDRRQVTELWLLQWRWWGHQGRPLIMSLPLPSTGHSPQHRPP